MKNTLMILVGVLFCVGVSAIAMGYEIGIQVNQGKISAELNRVPLKQLIEKIAKDTGIQFKCDESVLEEKISCKFNELSLKDGLQRLLKGLSYSFEYGKNQKIQAVVIVGTGKEKSAVSIAEPVEKSENLPEAFQVKSEEEKESFKIISNVPPPGGPVDEKELPPAFKVIENAPIPGKSAEGEK